MADPKRDRQGWKGAGGRAPAAATRGPTRKWKPTDGGPPGNGRRRVAQVALVAGLLACVLGAVYALMLLRTPPRAAVVFVAMDPIADGPKLDVPFDLYGWLTAKQFLTEARRQAEGDGSRWGKTALAVANRTDAPEALPADPGELRDWLHALRKSDPLVVYLGLPCRVGPGGPFLVTGGRAGDRPSRLAVADLLKTVADELAEKHVLILFDNGREPADPLAGPFRDDFAARLRDDPAVQEALRGCPNLQLVCGAAEGQRGWESEERQATAFGYAALRGLLGDLPPPGDGTGVATAADLFAHARSATEQWTRNNRPNPQTPTRLPDDDGRGRAIRVGIRPETPPPEPAVPAAFKVPDELARRWARHDGLAAARPHPAMATPRAWRRYRELLLRYEKAVRAGHPTGGAVDVSAVAGQLATALDAAEQAVVRGKTLPAPSSVQDSLALALAVGGNRPAGDPEKLPSDGRPVEAHLPVMVRDFAATVAPPGVPASPGWPRSVAVRKLAERAAVGLPAADGPPPDWVNPGRAWRAAGGLVRAADTHRRAAEDLNFSPAEADRAEAAKEVAAAEAGYKAAAQVAGHFERACAARDDALADLPFLTRYAAASPLAKEDVNSLVALWGKVHDLAAQLDALPVLAATPPELVKAADAAGKLGDEVSAALDARRSAFLAECKVRQSDTAIQKAWWPKQLLLGVPLVPAAERAAILEASRRVSLNLLTGTNPAQVGGTGSLPAPTKDDALACARLAVAALGVRTTDAAAKADPALPTAAFLDKDVCDAGAAGAADWGPRLTDAAEKWERLLAALAPAAGQAESMSRVAVAFDGDAGLEPAALAYRRRARDLYLGLAGRLAGDHWYDEATPPAPYFRRAADRALADAQAVAAEVPDPEPPFAVPDELRAQLDAPPLRGADLPEFQWTSEQRRPVQFRWPVPPGYPVAGRAVALPGRAAPTPLTLVPAANSARGAQELVAGKAVTLDEVLVAPPAGDSLTARATADARLYFRGQHPAQALPIKVDRRPELILADPVPDPVADRGAAVAVRGRKDYDLGELTILLDFSGSMRGAIVAGGQSKFQLALNTLVGKEGLLADLPARTRLRVRGFSGAGHEESSWMLHDGQVAWESAEAREFKELRDKLAGVTPRGFTPLARSIEDAAEDFTPGVSSKTLVVLTDGADEKPQEEAPAQLARVKGLRDNLEAVLKRTQARLFVVQFALSGPDVEVSKALFDGLKSPEATPMRVWNAGNQGQLKDALLDAIRPKLLLTQSNGSYPAGFPRSGWPSRAGAGTETESGQYWSPLVPADTYEGEILPGGEGKRTRLRLADGDRLLLDYTITDGRPKVRRRLYADFFADGGPVRKARSGDGGWALTAKGSGVTSQAGGHVLYAPVFLESVPPHLRGGGNGPAEDTVSSVRPELLWWRVTPAAADGKPAPVAGTVTVTRRYRFAAPAWEVRVEGWPRDPAAPENFLPATVRAWASNNPPPPREVTVGLGELGVPREVRVGDDTVTLTAAFEVGHRFGRPATDVPSSLVVRATHAPGRPVFVTLPARPGANVEHRYFEKANACTALFGPLAKADLPAGAVKLVVWPVGAWATDASPHSVGVTLPKPALGAMTDLDYQPTPAPADGSAK